MRFADVGEQACFPFPDIARTPRHRICCENNTKNSKSSQLPNEMKCTNIAKMDDFVNQVALEGIACKDEESKTCSWLSQTPTCKEEDH